MTRIRLWVAGVSLAVIACSVGAWLGRPDAEAQEGPEWNKGLPQQHKSKWLVHDINRPKPRKVSAGATPGAPPSDAIVLFDGKDLSRWERTNGQEVQWDVVDGVAQQNNSGSIRSKQAFGDCQIHIEWRNPATPKGVSQARGNSGIIIMERYEVQVLDNYDNPTYSDGYAGAVYGQHPPLVNACRPSGEWQTYDIIFRRPRFEGDEVQEPGRVTLIHNGVVVQHNAEIYGSVVWRQRAKYTPHGDTGKLLIQDHGDRQPMQFRNIWVRELDLSGGD